MAAPSVPLRFLVVDDAQDVRDVLSEMVETMGHTSHRARDGVEAVEALAVETYDFMLLDLSMPRMSGEDVLRWLSEHTDWAVGLRVVVVSARAGQRGVNAEDLGVHAVLPKPLRLQQLRDVVAPATSDTA